MSKRILVIDDERDVLDLIRTILKSKGYTILCANGGEEGLRLAEREMPDLIISDLMMPRVSGMEVVKRLRAHPQMKSIPIIVLSAISSDSDKPDEFWARGLGVDDYLSKPFDPLDLLGRVEYIFRRGKYVSQASSDAVPMMGDGAPAPSEPKLDLSQATPSQVVQAFVESWNSQDFKLEFGCMDETTMVGITESDYIRRRKQTYHEEKGDTRTQRVLNILSENISLNVAKVVCEREDMIGVRSRKKQETYALKKTGRGWRILKYTSEPIRRTTPSETLD